MRRSKWQKEANKRWGKKIVWVSGSDGPFAVLFLCRPGVIGVSLWPTMEEAELKKSHLCGGVCRKDHEIVDMAEAK